jgi:hypothetical protein
MDFLVDTEGKEQFYNVAFDLQPVQKEVHWEGVIVPNSMWAYAREGSAKEQMRLCYENTKAGNTLHNNTELVKRFSAEKLYEQFVGYVYKPNQELNDWMKTLEEEITEYE